MAEQLKSYREINTMGRSQIDLILQVYDGAISAFSGARSHYENRDLDAGYQALEKAKKFVTHLYTSLDFERGGEVARNLGGLYAYVVNLVSLAQASKQIEHIDQSLTILRNLREGWSDIRLQNRPEEQELTAADAPGAAVGQVNTSI
jgi:flagellar protein FliS